MIKSFILNSFLLVVLIIWMIPFIWMLYGAIVPTSVITGASEWTLASLTLSNFLEIFRRKSWFEGFINSITISFVSAFLVIMIGLICAFGLSRRGNSSNKFSLWLLSTRMLPPASILVSLLFYFQILKLIDTWSSLILINISINLGLFTLLLKSYLDKVDRSLEELLRTQGASLWKSFLITIFSKAKMPLLFSATLCFLFCWNEFLFASSFTAGGNSQTLTVITSGFITGQDVQWGPMFASCTLMILPAIITIWFLEKALLRGLTFGIVSIK